MINLWWTAIMAGVLATTGVALAQSTNGTLAVGAPAPEFAALGTNDQTNRLSELKGKWVVLYFYPRAFTPGCTAEACSLRDGHADLQQLGAVVLGVSLDGVARLKEFKAKYNLPFDLLSDEDKAVSRAYRTLGFGGLYAERKTFVIDPRGVLAHVFESVNTRAHDKEVAALLKKLQADAVPVQP
jgi:peroxiredoxin Q/BCP